MKYVYELVNSDADEGSAKEYVASSRRLNHAEELILKQCLDESKKEAAASGKEADTGEIVYDAIEKFKDRTGRQLHPYDSPFEATISF